MLSSALFYEHVACTCWNHVSSCKLCKCMQVVAHNQGDVPFHLLDFILINMYCSIFPTYENGSWRIKTNQELDKIIKHKNIISFARVQRLGWYGRIKRMQETSMVKAINSWKPISKRPTGRPKIRWEDYVKKDIQDRRRWKEVAEKAKTLY